MKKIVITLVTGIIAVGIIGGAVAAALQITQDDSLRVIKSSPEIIKYEGAKTEEEAMEEMHRRYNAYMEAKEVRIETEGFPELNDGTVTKESDWYNELKGFYIRVDAASDMARDAIDMLKGYGYISEDVYWEDFSDRVKYYSFIVECCEFYNDNSNQLTVDDRALLKWVLNYAYAPLASEFSVDEIGKPEVEAIRPQRDAALAAIESTGHPMDYMRAIELGLAEPKSGK